MTCIRCGKARGRGERFDETILGERCVRCTNEVRRRDLLGEVVEERSPLITANARSTAAIHEEIALRERYSSPDAGWKRWTREVREAFRSYTAPPELPPEFLPPVAGRTSPVGPMARWRTSPVGPMARWPDAPASTPSPAPLRVYDGKRAPLPSTPLLFDLGCAYQSGIGLVKARASFLASREAEARMELQGLLLDRAGPSAWRTVERHRDRETITVVVERISP